MIGAFTVDPLTFREAVGWVARWIPTRPTQPHLAGMTLVARDGSLTISGFSEDLSAQASIPLMAGSDAAVTVSGKLLAALAATLPTDSAFVNFMGERVVIKAGAATVTLPSMGEPVDDLTENDLPVVAHFPGANFDHAVAQVAPAASRNDYAGPLRAVRLAVSTDAPFSIMASDSYRVAWSTIHVDATANADVLVPADVLAEVTRTLRVVTLGASGNLVQFAAPDFRLTVRQIAGPYPIAQVQRALEYRPPHYFIVPLPELEAATKRAILVRTEAQPLMLDWDSDSKLCVSLAHSGIGAAETMWVNAYDGPPARIGVNPIYFMDALNSLDGDMALIGFDPENPRKPIVVADVDDDTHRQVVVPINLDKVAHG